MEAMGVMFRGDDYVPVAGQQESEQAERRVAGRERRELRPGVRILLEKDGHLLRPALPERACPLFIIRGDGRRTERLLQTVSHQPAFEGCQVQEGMGERRAEKTGDVEQA